MQPVRLEIDTRKDGSADSFQAGCLEFCRLRAIPQFLRHEVNSPSRHVVYLFGKEPDIQRDSPQIYVNMFRLPESEPLFSERLKSTEAARADFPLPDSHRFDPTFLAFPSIPAEFCHEAFRITDGPARRIVHVYRSNLWAVIVEFSLASGSFMDRGFFSNFAENGKFTAPPHTAVKLDRACRETHPGGMPPSAGVCGELVVIPSPPMEKSAERGCTKQPFPFAVDACDQNSSSSMSSANVMNPLSRIDWDYIATIYETGIPRLLKEVDMVDPMALCFWSDSNGGLNFDIYQIVGNEELESLEGLAKIPGGKQISLGDRVPGWGHDWSQLNDLFEEVGDELADDDDYESLDEKIRSTFRNVAERFAALNFGMASDRPVWWMITGEVYQDAAGAWRSIGFRSTKSGQANGS
jgi:hypothetical protein